MTLSAEFLKKIGEYMLTETPLAPADVCILYGNRTADSLAKHAAELYRRGMFKTIVSTGGVATDDGRLEAHRMRDVLIAHGVPPEAILVEDRATNSGENTVFSMALLAKATGLQNIKSVVAVGHISAARRFLMTLERHWPHVTKMFTAPNGYGVSPDRWHEHTELRRLVLAEHAKIAPYKARGLIAEIDLEKNAQKIAALKKPPPQRPPAP